MKTLHAILTVGAATLMAACASPDHRADLPSPARVVAQAPAQAAPAVAPRPDAQSLQLATLTRLAPDADPGVLALALEARACALRAGNASPQAKLAVIDYARPSTDKRLWVFDLQQEKVLFHEHVAHGQGSGMNMATAFSNRDGSHQTSLGLFRTAETYNGSNGYSLRMDGLDRGINDNARARAIVMHGAPYVNPEQARRQGRLGRSHGCPAVRPQVARQVIDTLKQDQLVFSYANDRAFLEGSRFFGCQGRSAGEILAAARNPVRGGGSLVAAVAAP